MSDFPEHDKLSEIAAESQAIGEFVDWMNECHHASFQVWSDCSYSHRPVGISIQKLLAEFFEIDEQALENEKRTMLERVRINNAKHA